MPKNINLTGSVGKKYDLDELANKQTRVDSTEKLIVQIWEWSPELPEKNPHHYPNPTKVDENGLVVSDLVEGQIWLSKLVAYNSPEFKKLLADGGK